MSNGRTEVYLVEQQVKGRSILNMLALLAIFLGVIVLAHEIALTVLNSHVLWNEVTTAQIIALTAAFFAIIAGLASYFPSRINASFHTLRRNFIASFVLSLIATILLSMTLGFFMPNFWNIWSAATMTPNALVPMPPQYEYNIIRTGNQNLDTRVPFPPANSGILWLSPYDKQYYQKVIAILKIVALLGDAILLVAALICTILSIINALRRRGSYQPAPVHDSSHGTRVYYEKTSR